MGLITAIDTLAAALIKRRYLSKFNSILRVDLLTHDNVVTILVTLRFLELLSILEISPTTITHKQYCTCYP